MDNRGVTPVVEKLLTIGIVVLFIGSVMAVLYGSAVPGYRDAAGAELGDRVVVSATEQIESAVPPNATAATGTARIDVPKTIRGQRYELTLDGRTLVLDHPAPAISGRVRLSLPSHVESVSGTLRSRDPGRLVIEDAPTGVRLRLGGGR